MSWRDELRPASFKGVSFYVRDHSHDGGRRLDKNEYPRSDNYFVDDLGASIPVYNINAYVIGANYITARNNLLTAIEQGGAGSLIHPYLGTKTVICETWSLRESQDEGGFAVFNLAFAPQGQKIFPANSFSPFDLINNSANQLINFAVNAFTNGIIINNTPDYVIGSFINSIGGAGDIFTNIQNNGGINNQSTLALINKAALWVADLNDINNPSITLLKNVAGIASRFVNLFAGMVDLSPSTAIASKNLNSLSNYEIDKNEGSTFYSKIDNTNQTETELFIKTVSVATESKNLINTEFKSYDDAIIKRKDVLEKIDEIANLTLNDDVYQSAIDLRQKIIVSIPGENNDLPKIKTINLKQTTPSLVVAYDIFENVAKEDDILARNGIRHPAFAPGGTDLQILENE